MDMKCRATNQAGQPCKADHYKDGWCRWHHPQLAEKNRQARIKGGKARSNAARARKLLKRVGLQDVDATLCVALEDVLEGRIDPGVANAAANVARAIHQVRSATEVEQRIAELEETLKSGRSA